MTNFIAKTLPRYFMIILIFVQCTSFNSTEELVVKICGVETYNSENIEIPENTIFPVDINFLPVNLYDIEGNVVTTSSWIECRHYVSGGWIYYDMGSQISINSVSLYKASGYLWIIFLPILFYVYWRTVEKN
tara:strand:+ start:604 stop:999 length:396 start_codon:yes stop_codon:yes gene_type:complete